MHVLLVQIPQPPASLNYHSPQEVAVEKVPLFPSSRYLPSPHLGSTPRSLPADSGWMTSHPEVIQAIQSYAQRCEIFGEWPCVSVPT